MAAIRCPQCGANNQDVTEKDTCWQCGKPLNAPAAVAEPVAPPQMTMPEAPAPPSPAAPRLAEAQESKTRAPSPGPPAAPLQRMPAEQPEPTSAGASQRTLRIVVSICVIALIVLLIWAIFLRK